MRCPKVLLRKDKGSVSISQIIVTLTQSRVTRTQRKLSQEKLIILLIKLCFLKPSSISSNIKPSM